MGVVGIPRALNTYEHYPYWFKLFSCLGFRVELSRPSDHALASSASETVPSQSLCFPAKLAHGHAADLARKGIADIWMPCVPLEGPRHSGEKHIDGRFACPVAGGYPEAMRLSLASTLPNARILTPFVDLEFPESVVRAVTSAWPALSPKKCVRRSMPLTQRSKTTAQHCVKRAKHCGAGMKPRANRSSCSPGGLTILTRSLITDSPP